jgi:ABC-type nitrate/sulfonate/bicarbonate transport system substrate-binding protein
MSKVTVVNMLPGPAALIALKQGDIDGLVAWEPWAAKAIVDGIAYTPKVRITDNSIGRINGVLGANLDHAAGSKDDTLAFLKAMIDVDAYLMANPDEHTNVAVAFMGIDAAVARKAIDNFAYDENIYMKPARAYAKLLYQYGLTKTDTSPTLDRAVDFTFLEAAKGKSRGDLGGD